MNLIRPKIKGFPLGVWIAFFALFLILFAWVMQIISLINWEAALKYGFQIESFNGDKAESALADVERAIAIADIIWVLPITLVAIVGLLRKKFIGFVAAQMTFAICVYFPLFYLFRKSTDSDVALATIGIWAIPSLIAIYCLWINRNCFTQNK